MLNKVKKIYIIVIAALMLLVSCTDGRQPGKDGSGTLSESAGGAWSYSFTDSTGALVTLRERPKTVAVLFSSYADIWVSAGGKVDITVGETVERGFAPDTAILVDNGSGHSAIDLETLTASAPDLVIGTADYACQANAAEFCRSAGIPSALFRVESFSDYLNVLKIFCDITGDEERYREYGTEVENRINALFERIKSRQNAGEGAPSVLFVRAGSSAKSTKAKTAADNFVCVMLEELGARNIADSENGLAGTLSLEKILTEDPDRLFITTMGDETAAKEYMNSLLASDGWRELDCVKNGNCFYLSKDLFHFKPNARWAEAYEYLAALLFPENVP